MTWEPWDPSAGAEMIPQLHHVLSAPGGEDPTGVHPHCWAGGACEPCLHQQRGGREGGCAGWGGGPWFLATASLMAVSPQNRLQEQQAEGPSQLLVDTSHFFPVQLPFIPSPLHLDELCIPSTVDLAFLVRL